MAIRNTLKRLQGLSMQLPTLWEFTTQEGPEDLKLYVQSTSLNFPTLETQRDGARGQYYSNYNEPSEFSMTFLETDDFFTTNWLEAWMDEIFDRQKKVFRTGDHSRTGLLTFQKFTSFIGDLQETKTYKFTRMLLQSIDSVALDYASTDKLTISATFSAYTIEKLGPSTSTVPGL